MFIPWKRCSLWLVVLAVLSIISGLIVGTTSESFLYWFFAGLVSAIFCWALSILTRAAEIYISMHSKSFEEEV